MLEEVLLEAVLDHGQSGFLPDPAASSCAGVNRSTSGQCQSQAVILLSQFLHEQNGEDSASFVMTVN